MTNGEIQTARQAAARIRQSVALVQRGERQLQFPDVDYPTALEAVNLEDRTMTAPERMQFVLQKSQARDRRASWDSGRYQSHVIGEFRHHQAIYDLGRKLSVFGGTA